MKKILITLIFLILINYLKAQAKENGSFLKNSTDQKTLIMKQNGTIKNISLKNYLMVQKKSSKEKYSPTFSVDLLDGSGIHLFTISHLGTLPTLKVGARINAGIKISI